MTTMDRAVTETTDAAAEVVAESPPESTDPVDTSWMDAMPTVVLPWLSAAAPVAPDEASPAPMSDSSWMDALPEVSPPPAMILLREEAERAASSDKKQEPAP